MPTKTGVFTKSQLEKHNQFSRRLSASFRNLLPLNKPVIDYGCGKGEYLSNLQSIGIVCHGYDGTVGVNDVSIFKGIKKAEIHKSIKPAKGKSIPEGSVLCLDVIEHIPRKFESVVINNLTSKCTGRLVLQWSNDSESENPRDSYHILKKLEEKGFVFNLAVTERFRTEGGADIAKFKRTIYVFERK